MEVTPTSVGTTPSKTVLKLMLTILILMVVPVKLLPVMLTYLKLFTKTKDKVMYPLTTLLK